MEIKLDYNNQSIYINQNKYLNILLDKFNKRNLNPVITLVEAGVRLDKLISLANKEDLQLY